MGIRGLQTFVEQKLSLLNEIQLHHCNVVFDGNSIYHQMYSENGLTCLFGGEYDRFYLYCTQLFESFRTCNINIIVVFDGARIDDRKLATTLARAKKRVDYSTRTSVNVDLSPLLLRQTFINVLETMHIPFVSALGEGDDECVSLANHLDAYLISRDSDYFCYNLHRGYIPFDYVDINPIEKDSISYLSAQHYHVDSLIGHFNGLQYSTLALACCLCGNDYINGNILEPIFSYIVATVEKSKTTNKKTKNIQSRHWFIMQWMRHYDSIDTALEQLLQVIKSISERTKIEVKLRSALQCYVSPADTLIYRFISSTNQNLLTNPRFVHLARSYLDTLHMSDDELQIHIENDSQVLKSKSNRQIGKFLIDGLSDLRMPVSFIEILIHRRMICSAHIEIEREPSIYTHAIPILLRCFAILLKWDNESNELSIVIYHRVNKQLKGCIYSLVDYMNDVVELDQIDSMSLNQRQDNVGQCLKMPFDLLQQWNHIHSDYHFWLIIIRYWYFTRRLPPVYLYAVIISFVKSTILNDDSFSFPSIEEIRKNLDVEIRRKIFFKLQDLTKKILNEKTFDICIIHELNCLQTIYMYSLQVNEFFLKPFLNVIHPHQFIFGSLFYAFVDHYETKTNMFAAMEDLFHKDIQLITFRMMFLRFGIKQIVIRRTLTIRSTMNEIIGRLSLNYKTEFEQLTIGENEQINQRIHFLKTTLQAMKIRDQLMRDIVETKQLRHDPNNEDLSQMANDELIRLNSDLTSIDNEILDCILPEELADNDDAEVEVAAGVGGQEAMLFAKEIFHMYANYANFRKWSFDIVEFDQTDIGGVRQGKAFINGRDVFKSLKYECGVHRVQRVPQTEKSGRIHTSTVTVAVLPQPKDIKIELPAKDILAEPIRARGPGGQHVNKSESGCRLTHLPTGIVLERQDERFFNMNKNLAIKAMKNKLYQMQYDEQQTHLRQTRKQQTGSGNRNEKIRTYNIPQNRITDERLNENAYNVEEFLEGNQQLHSMIEALKQQDRLQRLIELTNKTMKEEEETDNMLHLANVQAHEVICNALFSLTKILPSTTTIPSIAMPYQNSLSAPSNRTLRPTVSLRCRSSSSNNTRDRKISFHHTIPRCSLPATKNDFFHYQQTNQNRYRSSQNVNGNCSNRTFDVQYSFSLHKPWLTKIDKQRHHLISVQNFVSELIEHSIRAAFVQIDYQHLTNNTLTNDDDTSCLLFDCYPSYAPVERLQTIYSFADRLISSTVQQSIRDLSLSDENAVEHLSNRLVENILTDALLTLTDNENYSKLLLTDDEKTSRKNKKRATITTSRLISNENNEHYTLQSTFFRQIRHRSSSAIRTLSNSSKRETVDMIVTNIAQQIYVDSFDELRRIFTTNNQ